MAIPGRARPPSRTANLPVAQSPRMTGIRSRWPAAILVFLGYAFLLLAVEGLLLRWVIDLAITTPVSLIGLVWMVLLAYTIFTITLTLQRKQAARNLALGLATLPVPLAAFLVFAPNPVIAIGPLVLAAVVLIALTRPSARTFFSEP